MKKQTPISHGRKRVAIGGGINLWVTPKEFKKLVGGKAKLAGQPRGTKK